MAKGDDKYKAFTTSVKNNAHPIFLTSLTTMLGFLALNSTEVLPFHHLGNSAALGVAVAFVFAMTLLPALPSNPSVRATPRATSV